MTQYHHHIALIVPRSQKEPANEAAAALTGRPPDQHTFRDEPGRRFLDDDGAVYLIAGPTPFTPDQEKKLPLLAAQFDVDAHWEVIAVWDDGRQPLTTVDEWAASLGLEREPVGDDPR